VQFLNLNHYSDKPINFDPTHMYELRKKPFKPDGLWLSDERSDDGWRSWCENQPFGLDRLVTKTIFQLEVKQCLWLRHYQDIKDFTMLYRVADEHKFLCRINWEKVMRDYKGLLITPYCWEARYEFIWYNGWDCASACIWDLSIIKEVGP
jgi:hypothetical protein